MKTFPPWYKLLPRRLSWEREVLHGLPFFKHEADGFDKDANFTATGTLFYRGERSGKPEGFRLEVVYPRRFPGIAQMVYDKEKRFALCENGHLFSDHQLCLTLRERNEFSLNTEALTEEVLGAALVWFNKRLIFERNGRRDWPGPAEAHGAQAQVNFMLEEAGLLRNASASVWANELYQRALLDHHFVPFDPYSLCPCLSGKKMKFCHGATFIRFGKLLQRVARATEAWTATTGKGIADKV
jgi:hypothetical protein